MTVLSETKCDRSPNACVPPISAVKHLHVEMGYQCNYRCTFCYQVDFSAKQNMDERIWREALRPIYPALKTAFLQGGEPTIMRNCIGFRDMMVKEHPSVKLGTVTNGLRFDDEWADIMIDHGYLVQFSLNAASKKVYDRTMRYGDYAAVHRNIRSLVEKRSRRPDGGKSLMLSASFVVLPENVCEIADFIGMAADSGFDQVKFFIDQILSATSSDAEGTLREIERGYEAHRAHPGLDLQGLEIFEHLYRARHKPAANSPDAAARCTAERATAMCTIPWTQVYVKHRGEVTFCCMTWRNFGNLHKEDIQTLWNSGKAQQFRRMMLQSKYTFCSPACLSNPKPDFSRLWPARKFAYSVAEDPVLILKKAQNKIRKFFAYRKMSPSVSTEFESVQPRRKSGEGADSSVL